MVANAIVTILNAKALDHSHYNVTLGRAVRVRELLQAAGALENATLVRMCVYMYATVLLE